MFIGINWSSSYTANIVQELTKKARVDFCEILIDNFLLYEPELIKEALPISSCAFHIMHSHFLYRDLNDLLEYGKRIKKAATILHPIYISDHIGVFDFNNRRFASMQEISYDKAFEIFKQRACIWSDLLEHIIYYENYPSFEMQTSRQVDFFLQIQTKLKNQANILFDVSNAIVAEKNGCENAAEWKTIALGTKHFHVGGYEKAGDINFYLDSHNQAISYEAQKLIMEFEILNRTDCTLTIERDSNFDISDWQRDINTMRGLANVSLTA